MKGGSLFKKIIYSSWFLASVPAILIIIFLHPFGSKYKLLVKPSDKFTGQFVYADLNSDSISEAIYTGKGVPYYYVVVRDNDFRFCDQWNLKDSLDSNISDLFIGNYDHDRFKEIYIFTHKGDSLFLNVNELLEPSGVRFDRLFITKIGFEQRQVTSVLKIAGFFDENGDGRDELYFNITTGFAKDPRRMYYYDLVHKSIHSSQFTGIICLNPRMKDVNGDKRPEIFGDFSACGNFGRSVPFSDSSTWFMVFNDKLNFEFPPVEFPGYVNGLETSDYDNGSFKGYVLSHWAGGADTTILKSRIMICSTDGKIIRSRLYTDFGNFRFIHLYVIKNNLSDKIYLLDNKFIELNDKLEVTRTVELPFNSNFATYEVDINADSEDEFLLYSEDEEKILIYDAGLNKLTESKFKTPDTFWKFSQYYTKDHEHSLFLKSGNNGHFLNLIKNRFYYIAFLAFPGVYLLFVLFIILIKRINTIQVEQKESLKRRLVALQLQAIKSQLDPHFTFNTLNSVASLIYLEDRQAAYDYMHKFTHLLRGMLNDAERVYRSLKEELEFVTTYLDLEKLRFGEKFNYDINVSEEVSQHEQVPKLVLQTFAENAVKHGIMPSESGGLIKISANMEKDYLKLTIEDNGIGREQSAGHSNSTGKGLKLTYEFYEILNQINKKPIKHLITDLYNDSLEPAGTRVEVWVPVDEFANYIRS